MANNTVAYGFTGLVPMFSERVTTVGIETMWNTVQAWRDEHNRIVNEMLSSFVMRTTMHQTRVYLPGTGTLQPVDEWGNPLPMRPEGYYDVGYPMKGGATAYGFNRISVELATVEELNRYILTVEYQDMDWLRRHMLAALFHDASYTYSDPLYGDITVQPLANNDTVTYLKRGGAMEADTHYLAQADDIDATHDPFPTIYSELVEHPGNMGPMVVYIPTNLVSDVEDLTDLIEPSDPEIRYGADSDTIAQTDPFAAGIVRFGTKYIGRKNRMYLVEWPSLPDSYMLAVAHGAAEPLLKQREYPAAALQGLYAKQTAPNESLEKFSFFRDCGFGVHNRVAAVAYYVGAASYTDPTVYATMPLAV
jgi:hypothetical protein